MTAPRPLLLLAAGLALAGCAPRPAPLRAPAPVAALPPTPRADGPLRLQLVYPPPGALRPDADSTFVFGQTGTGRARLFINGYPVDVAANGAFLAFLPTARQYRLTARRGRQRDTLVYHYAVPPPAPPAAEAFAPRTARVVAGLDTLATGSQIAGGAPLPGADRRWFFPLGTRVQVDGELAGGAQYRVRLTPATAAWVDADAIAWDSSEAAPALSPRLDAHAGYTDVVFGTRWAPFLVEAMPREARITIYGSGAVPAFAPGAGLSALDALTAPDSTVVTARMDGPLWGFKAFYDGEGRLVVRLRRAPRLDPAHPLRGARIVVDAGHPPGGATGPTGLREPTANLAVALRLAEGLRAAGATVLMTRTGPDAPASATSQATDLWARVDSAVAWNADVLVSLHNNAFPDGVNPFRHVGTETYYFHPFAQPLARALLDEIAPVTGLQPLGAKARSLALVRPTWMPSTLTESLFLMFPQQEAALGDAAFVEKLAAAHLRGIENFLRQALGR